MVASYFQSLVWGQNQARAAGSGQTHDRPKYLKASGARPFAERPQKFHVLAHLDPRFVLLAVDAERQLDLFRQAVPDRLFDRIQILDRRTGGLAILTSDVGATAAIPKAESAGAQEARRKAGATRLANNGATVAQLNAIYGRTGSKMASLLRRMRTAKSWRDWASRCCGKKRKGTALSPNLNPQAPEP